MEEDVTVVVDQKRVAVSSEFVGRTSFLELSDGYVGAGNAQQIGRPNLERYRDDFIVIKDLKKD